MSDDKKGSPIKGIRILDLSRILAGPYCSMILSDLGAEVIKIEIPNRGDDTREYPPFIDGESSYFLSVNRGKKSVTLNLKTEKGREVLYKLVKKSDVFLENYRSGITESLGVDYDTIKKINPKVVYCSISSFGRTGPYKNLPGYDLIIQGMGGLMSVTGEEGRPPVRINVGITDIGAGMWATIAILSALIARDRTGEGQYIDISMLDCSVAWMSYMAGNYFVTGKVLPRMGSAHPSIVPYQAFKTADDKYILIAAGNDKLWGILCHGLGVDEWAKDPKYITAENRVVNRDILIPLLEAKFTERNRDEWLEILKSLGFPCGPVYDIDEIFKDPHILYRGMLVEIRHRKLGSIKQVASPLHFSDTLCNLIHSPPMLGEHTDEVLKTVAGYSDKEIKVLRMENVI